jgi:ferredoxin-NADP reductase
MALDGFDVQVLYRAHAPADLVFKQELDSLSARFGFRIDYLLTEDGSRKRNRDGWFKPEALVRLVPEITKRVVYVCGPVSMKGAVLAALHEVGVPSSQIRTEVFRLQ